MADFRANKDQGHYFIEGKRLPGVTTVLDIVTSKELLHWFKTTDYQKQKEVSDKALNIGSAVHLALENLLKSRQNGTEEQFRTNMRFMQPTHIKNAITALDQFEAEVGRLEPLGIEETLHTDDYAGTCDFVGKINNKLVLLDFKTSKRIYETYELQLHAYANAWEHMHGDTPERLYCVRIDKQTGKLEYKEYLYTNETLAVFLHILAAYQWFNPQPKHEPQRLIKTMLIDGIEVQLKNEV